MTNVGLICRGDAASGPTFIIINNNSNKFHFQITKSEKSIKTALVQCFVIFSLKICPAAFLEPFSRDTFRGIAGFWLGVFLQSKGAAVQILCRNCWDKGGMCGTN